MNQVGFPDDAPVDEVDEQLVAYLDGELPPEEIRALEQRLGLDATLRARLRELQNGWEMLDELPLASSSNTLLETTIRMAAVDGDAIGNKSAQKRLRRRFTGLAWIAAATVACFFLGLAMTRGREYLKYRQQLRDLPIAMHLDAYLHASDLELMNSLAKMPQWQQANEVADRLGKWQSGVAKQIDNATAREREKLLPTLPLEDQQTLSAAWERFENIGDKEKEMIYATADRVSRQGEASQSLLQTMDRFALWRESLDADDIDKLTNGTEQERQVLVETCLERTLKKWARERGGVLSDDEVETIYHAVRQIAKLRLKHVQEKAPADIRASIESFGSSNQSMEPRAEAFFLRYLFDPSFGGPNRRDGDRNGPPVLLPSSFPPGFGLPALGIIRTLTESIRGPLRDDELYMIQSVLPQNLSAQIDAEGSRMLSEELLRIWVDESLLRTQWNRSGQNAVERYQSMPSDEREEIDLKPADKMLRSLRNGGFGRR